VVDKIYFRKLIFSSQQLQNRTLFLLAPVAITDGIGHCSRMTTKCLNNLQKQQKAESSSMATKVQKGINTK
jgi:hypothetical protein